MAFVALFFLFFFNRILIAQDPVKLFEMSRTAQDKGDFKAAEQYLLEMLKQKDKLIDENVVTVYNQLGIISKSLGNYDKSADYYFKGESIALSNIKIMRYKLPSLYNNLGNLFKHKGDYEKALEYYQECIKNLDAEGLDEKERKLTLAQAYSNAGITYYFLKEYGQAKTNFEKSIRVRKDCNLKGLDIDYNNYANCLRESNDYKNSEIYYQKCIDIRIKDYGQDYYKLAFVYEEFGNLKMKNGDIHASMNLYSKALNLFINNYGTRHPYTAEIHRVIGDYYFALHQYEKALEYYQQSLISNSSEFKSTDIGKNPAQKSVFSELQLLHSLKKKADALLALTDNQADKNLKEQMLISAIGCLEEAFEVVQNVRHGYISQESRLFITKNEKDFYMSAIKGSLRLFELTGDKLYIEKAYRYSRASKAVVLLNEIKQNEAFTNILPDRLKKKKNNFEQDIASFKKLIIDENQEKKPDQDKISRWQSEVFQLGKKYEELLKSISNDYPVYSALSEKATLPELGDIRKYLSSYETIIEYSYAINENGGLLYTFVFNKEGLKYYKQPIDSTFEQNIGLYREKMNLGSKAFANLAGYNQFNEVLYQLYKVLIAPLKPLDGKELIIIPDEKIAYLSFDALISDYKQERDINYRKPHYLLYDYIFSYEYSSNLLVRRNRQRSAANEVYAFAPQYHSPSASESRDMLGELKNARNEIQSIMKYFDGEKYTGDSATKKNFESSLKHKGIYHLAMHANSMDNSPAYSYLAFSRKQEGDENELLYNYEIGSMPIHASMIVLSACNTGNGKIYSGEGVMSLSREFILAGSSSVVHGLWKLNDEASSVIMGNFYKYLSQGKQKDEALRLAKIDYLETSSPEMASPVYWSGIVLMGDRHPLVTKWYPMLFVFVGIGLFFLLGFYFVKRRRTGHRSASGRTS